MFDSHPVAAFMQTEFVHLAEVFVLFHEIQHTLPDEHRMTSVKIQKDSSFPSDRADSWLEELQADADALYLLLLAAMDSYPKRFGISADQAKEVAAGTVFTAADAALHALQTLERVRVGDETTEKLSDPAFRSHPPTQIRRNSLAQVGKALGSRLFDGATWNRVRDSIGSTVHVRQQLFDEFFSQRGDIVAEVRDV